MLGRSRRRGSKEGVLVGVDREALIVESDCNLKKLAALPRWPSSSFCSDNAATDSRGLVIGRGVTGNRLGVDPAVEGNGLGEPLHPRWVEPATGG